MKVNLTLQAGDFSDPASRGNISIAGSSLFAGRDATLAATGNVALSSVRDTAHLSYSKSSSGLLSSSSKKQEAGGVTQVGSSLVANNVNILAGDNIRLSASDIFAGNNARLESVRGDIILDSARNESIVRSQSKSSSVGVFGTGNGCRLVATT